MKKLISSLSTGIYLLLALSLFFGAVPSMAMSPQTGGTLRVSMDVDIKSLDPHQIGWQNHEVLRQIFEGILAVDDGFGIIPGLAERWRGLR